MNTANMDSEAFLVYLDAYVAPAPVTFDGDCNGDALDANEWLSVDGFNAIGTAPTALISIR